MQSSTKTATTTEFIRGSNINSHNICYYKPSLLRPKSSNIISCKANNKVLLHYLSNITFI